MLALFTYHLVNRTVPFNYMILFGIYLNTFECHLVLSSRLNTTIMANNCPIYTLWQQIWHDPLLEAGAPSQIKINKKKEDWCIQDKMQPYPGPHSQSCPQGKIGTNKCCQSLGSPKILICFYFSKLNKHFSDFMLTY